jgi:tetrahydromethanopterin S-methyltransferase subunit F
VIVFIFFTTLIGLMCGNAVAGLVVGVLLTFLSAYLEETI